jgi:hypothetical protein
MGLGTGTAPGARGLLTLFVPAACEGAVQDILGLQGDE